VDLIKSGDLAPQPENQKTKKKKKKKKAKLITTKSLQKEEN
jgi:hypothetical protein